MADLFSFLSALMESQTTSSDDNKLTTKLSKPKLEVEDNELKRCSGNIVDLIVPDGITGIWSGALSSETQKTLKTVVIPEGIEYIRSNTFQDCTHLVSVKLPESVHYIQTKAFANCVNLRKINFPENIKEVSPDAFDNCPYIKLPEWIDSKSYFVEQNGSKARLMVINGEVSRCEGKFVDLVIPEGVTAIWSLALSSETKKTLKTVVIPEGIETIRANTFQDCKNLVSVKLPESITSIRTKAFANCVNLREINLPENIEEIVEDAFLNCPHIKVPEIKEEIDEDEYYSSGYYSRRMSEIVGGVPDESIKNPQTPQLTKKNIIQQPQTPRPTKHNVIHGNTLIGMRTDDFTIPAYEAINPSSFRMSKMESLHISEGVTVIGKYAFEYCQKLKEVYLPKSLVRIDSRAFAECSQLETVNFHENLEWIAKDAFDGCGKVNLSESAKRLMQNQDEMMELLAILHSSGIHQSYMKNANWITLNNDGMYMDILRREDGTYNVSVPVDKWNCKGFDCKTFDELKVKIQRSFKLYI